jgi:hypothetical protein
MPPICCRCWLRESRSENSRSECRFDALHCRRAGGNPFQQLGQRVTQRHRHVVVAVFQRGEQRRADLVACC